MLDEVDRLVSVLNNIYRNRQQFVETAIRDLLVKMWEAERLHLKFLNSEASEARSAATRQSSPAS